MKLNHDCVRDVLLFLEDNLSISSTIFTNDIIVPSCSQDDIDYTVKLLIESGMLEGEFKSFISGQYTIYVNSITWSGHKFLDNVRDNTVWVATKKSISKLGSVSLEIMSQVAASILTNLLINK